MEIGKDYLIAREHKYLKILLPDSIGMEESEILLQEITEQLADSNDLLVVDMSNTTVIYSSGFGLLIRIRKLVSEKLGNICLVNVSEKVNKFFREFNLERVFKIYSTDVEFELDNEDIWKSTFVDGQDVFIFAANKEENLYRINMSGHMTTLNNFTSIMEFQPDPEIKNYIFNFENLEIIDTYGAQLCNELIHRIHDAGGKCILYGLKSIAATLFELFGDLKVCKVCESEEDALAEIQ